MKKSRKVWIPAVVAGTVALLLLAYYYFWANAGGEGRRPPLPDGVRPPRDEGGNLGDWFTTIGTVALYLAAAGFSWFWFKKKLKSPSIWVRRLGKLLYAAHKPLGWATLAAIVLHGGYFLLYKSGDRNIYSGLAGFALLLAIVGYGVLINKVRNRWMRLVHRTLGVAWVPVMFVHAGGSAIIATLACAGVWILIGLLEKMVAQPEGTIPESL
ncbi:hypothetical protein [Cohnella soli]|uniref:Ferric oxidoreductase domain-containing protein n=1 Tax=Cohnella soli TaxID=425005 RepID=A0ABW0I0T9_9BACL